MQNLIKITLSLTLLATLIQAKTYEDAEDGNTQGWRIFDNTPSGATISNIEDNGNRVIKLSGDITRNAYIIGGTSKVADKPNKWDAREGKKLSFKIKFDEGQRPEILVAIRPAHQSDKILYIRYRSATRHDENGWNRSGSILSIKLDETLESGEWLSITRDIEKDLQAYRHPFDPTQNSLIAINGMIIYGSALVDDIQIERSHEALTTREPLIPANCKGEIVKKGLDLNDNGLLEESEVTSTNENYTEGTPIRRTELKEMIANDEDITQVNTCKIVDMSGLFINKSNFNQDISSWNTGSVTNMQRMFDKANSFNQPINTWDVSKVKNMSWMFCEATQFNQPIDNWDVSRVINMEKMFSKAYNFNQDIRRWDTGSVKNMSWMFEWLENFNNSIEEWDVSNVTNMSGMFHEAHNFDESIKEWNVSNVTNMSSMFSSASRFNQPINQWNVSNVTNMQDMFSHATQFNQPLKNWNVSNVLNMSGMFEFTKRFNQNISTWNVSHVINMESMFNGARGFNQCIKNWDISNVENINMGLKYINKNEEKKHVYDQDSWNEYILNCPKKSCISHPIEDYLQDHPLYSNELLKFDNNCSAYILNEYAENLKYLYFNPISKEIEIINTGIKDALYFADLRGYTLFFLDNERTLTIRGYSHDYAIGEDFSIFISLAHDFIYDISDPKNPRLVYHHNIELGHDYSFFKLQ